MINAIERDVFRLALKRYLPPRVPLATIFVDLPNSNGKLHACITRCEPFNQLTAVILPHESPEIFPTVAMPQADIVLPDNVVHFIRANLRIFNIRHIVGIMPESLVPKGRPLVVTGRGALLH